MAPRSTASLMQIICDASPWGLGAILVQDGSIIRWIASALTDTDLQVLGVSRGDCRGQGAFEALAICVAMREWLPLWQDESTSILVKSDSMAALGALNREGSSRPLINKVVREIALDLAEGIYNVEVLGHQPALWNGIADALSRLDEPEADTEFPTSLEGVPRTETAPRPLAWWRSRRSPSG